MQLFFSKCTIGKTELISSIVILLLVLITSSYVAFTDSGVVVLSAILILGLFFAPLLIMPLSVEMTEDKIVINRIISNKIIFVDSILSVMKVKKNDFYKDRRVAGASGLFGYYGYFKSRMYGKYFACANNSKELINIIYDNKILLLSCDNSDKFIEILGNKIEKL